MNLVRYIEKIKKKVFGATSDDILRDLEQGEHVLEKELLYLIHGIPL